MVEGTPEVAEPAEELDDDGGGGGGGGGDASSSSSAVTSAVTSAVASASSSASSAAAPRPLRALLLAESTLVRTDLAELFEMKLPAGKAAAVVEDCSLTFDSIFNFHHNLFSGKHARSSCTFDSHSMLIDLRQWRKDDMASRLLDLLGTQVRTEGLYLQPSAAANDLAAASLLALDKRSVRLPQQWLAPGLSRSSLTFAELQYWQRLWGQQYGTPASAASSTQPFCAMHVVGVADSGAAAAAEEALPGVAARSSGDPLLLGFSGGPHKPWLRRCSGAAQAAAPLCGRPPSGPIDCALIWRRYLHPRLVPVAESARRGGGGGGGVAMAEGEAAAEEAALRTSKQFPCAAEPGGARRGGGDGGGEVARGSGGGGAARGEATEDANAAHFSASISKTRRRARLVSYQK